jgi:hypothetical protein
MAEGPERTSAHGPLEGEDIETEHWEDARHWMSIYDDLIRFKLGLLERVTRELPKLHPVAQKAAKVDVTFIENQMAGYYDRLDLWYQRVWKLQASGSIPTVGYYATREKRPYSPIESLSSCSSCSTILIVFTPLRRLWATPGRTRPCTPKKSATIFRA